MAEQKNPFSEGSTGAGAYKAAYDRLKAEAEARKQGIGENYSSAYQQLRQQGYGMGLGASAQRGLSGGQAAGVRNAISAQQMGQLGNLMQGQERALRESKLGEQSIYSNALLEGQQAQEYQRSSQQADTARVQQTQDIVNDTKKTEQEKRQLLTALGYNEQEVNQFINQGLPNSNINWWRYGAYIMPSNWGKSIETLQWEAEQKNKNPFVTQQQLDAQNPYKNR
jgi:hypothetical protein